MSFINRQAGFAHTLMSAAVLAALQLTVSVRASEAEGTPRGTTASGLPSVTASRDVCAKLAGITVAGITLSATVVPANGAAPSYCKANGTLDAALNFEVRLPDSWNGKLVYEGGGGYDGSIPKVVVSPLVQGYAEVASDSGHKDIETSAAFALHDAHAAQLFGYLSVPTVMSSALKVVTAAYGAPPTKSYFEGCSNGGREALMAVQRNPTLFAGVIARAPGFNWVGLMGKFHQMAEAISAPGGEFSAVKLALLAKHVREACDGLDGIVDGIVSNPAACSAKVVNIDALRCPGGIDSGDSCLSDAQLAVIRVWTSNVKYRGSSTYESQGYNLTGNEDDPLNFGFFASGNGDVKKAAHFLFQDTTVKNYLARDPDADSLAYEPWDRDPDALRAMAALNDATQTDIRPFVDHGGKLIVWHGGADPGLSVNTSIKYMEDVRKSVGAKLADAATRLYVAPGVDHCQAGPGADQVDLLGALDRWVTKGVAPATLTARKLDESGSVLFSRPLCRYPQYPRYTGPLDEAAAAKLASSYTCTTPVKKR